MIAESCGQLNAVWMISTPMRSCSRISRHSFGGQRAGLEEHGVGNADLANIVQKCSGLDNEQLAGAQPGAADLDAHLRYPPRMLRGLRVAEKRERRRAIAQRGSGSIRRRPLSLSCDRRRVGGSRDRCRRSEWCDSCRRAWSYRAIRQPGRSAPRRTGREARAAHAKTGRHRNVGDLRSGDELRNFSASSTAPASSVEGSRMQNSSPP